MNFKKYGKNVQIYPLAKICKPEVIEIGDHTQIDDFTFINGGDGIKIGRYVHIASFVSIIGGGEVEIGDYAAVTAGCRIISGGSLYHEGKRMSSALPESQRTLQKSKVIIGKDAFIGTNTVIHPGVTIGEGAIIGTQSMVNKDIEPWTVNVGIPCKKIGERPKVQLEDI